MYKLLVSMNHWKLSATVYHDGNSIKNNSVIGNDKLKIILKYYCKYANRY